MLLPQTGIDSRTDRVIGTCWRAELSHITARFRIPRDSLVGGEALGAFALGPLVALRALVVARARKRGLRQRGYGDQLDAIDRARRHAQLAPGAPRGDHGVHELRGAHDRVDRARLDALGAADARLLVDARDRGRGGRADAGIQRDRLTPERRREPGDHAVAAGRAAVVLRRALRHRLGIRAAAVVAAARALGLG